jgi:MoaA/NifB/PqqE/SkfB family radical SAM enzyme
MSLASARMLDIFLNYACQAKCPFCYNPPLTPALLAWHLNLRNAAALLVSGRDQGYDGATFSGGEVTLLKDLNSMIRLARKLGYREAGVITNGLRLEERAYVDSLAEAGLTFCCVSMHGAAAATHDRLLVVPGAHARVLAALDNLRALKIPIILNFVVTNLNAAELPDFVAHHIGDPSVVEIQAYLPHYEGMMRTEGADLSLSIADARPHLSAAAARADALAAGDKINFYTAPPCALPELRGRLRNWKRETDSVLADPQGLAGAGFAEERRDRIKPAACTSCALCAECLGFERGYVDRYGDSEAKAFAA